MNNSATTAKPAKSSEGSPSEAIYDRTNEIRLKLLDAIERAISDGKVPSAHLEAYETLCRAEAARRG